MAQTGYFRSDPVTTGGSPSLHPAKGNEALLARVEGAPS